MIPLSDYLDVSRIVDLAARNRDEAIVELCRLLEGDPRVPDPAAFRDAVLEREKVMSTGIGLGIAVPHAKISSVKDFVLAVGRSPGGIEFTSLDGRPVRIVVLIAGPEDRQSRYLQILAGVTLRLKDETLRRRLLEASGPAEIRDLLAHRPA